MTWFENMTFSDFILAGTTLLAAIAAYFNLNFKVANLQETGEQTQKKIEELEKDTVAMDVRQGSEVASLRTDMNNRFSSVEERMRITDVFNGRMEEKLNYLSSQVDRVLSLMEKSK